MSRNGRRAPIKWMARSQLPGLLKSHEPPPGPGRTSKAPAGRTPKLGLLAAAAFTRGGENTSELPPPRRALWRGPQLPQG
eukprot:15447678-Alexandrium_andersonii.AAC.1